jgi:hypothetical protein
MTFNAGSTLNDLAGSLNIGVHAVGSFIANGTAGRPTVINTADALVGQYARGVGTVTIDNATWNASPSYSAVWNPVRRLIAGRV